MINDIQEARRGLHRLPFFIAFILLLPFKVQQFDGKGRGVVQTKPFKKEDFIIEYIGNLMDLLKPRTPSIARIRNMDLSCTTLSVVRHLTGKISFV